MTALTLKNTIQTLLDKTGFNRLEKRERQIVTAGLIFLACFALFHFVASPLIQVRQQTHKALIRKQEELQKMVQLQENYRKLQNQATSIEERLEKRSPGFSLFSFIEEKAGKAGVKQQINSMTPSSVDGEGALQESRVDLKLERLSLQQLVSFLQEVESPDNVVVIKRISIQENSREDNTLDATMQIVTFSRKP